MHLWHSEWRFEHIKIGYIVEKMEGILSILINFPSNNFELIIVEWWCEIGGWRGLEMDSEVWGEYKEQGEILNKNRAWDNRERSSTAQNDCMREMKKRREVSKILW